MKKTMLIGMCILLVLIVGCKTEQEKEFNLCMSDCMDNSNYVFKKLCQNILDSNYNECNDYSNKRTAENKCYLECKIQ